MNVTESPAVIVSVAGENANCAPPTSTFQFAAPALVAAMTTAADARTYRKRL